MSSPLLEGFLARLYSDADLRDAFLDDPRAQAQKYGLSEAEVDAMCRIDQVGLQMAARSYAAKRAGLRPRVAMADKVSDQDANFNSLLSLICLIGFLAALMYYSTTLGTQPMDVWTFILLSLRELALLACLSLAAIYGIAMAIYKLVRRTLFDKGSGDP